MAVAADALPVEPSVDRVRALAADYNLIPLRHSFIDDTETPVSAFLKLRAAAPEQPAFLLESAERGQQFGRYSFIGVQPRSVIRWSLGDEPADPYGLAAAEVGRYTQAPLDDLPPFAGGAVGFFGYDLVRTVEPLGEPNPDPVGLPDMALMLSDVLVVFDHLKHMISILAHVHVEDGTDVDAEYAAALHTIAEVRETLAGAVPRVAPHAPRPAPEFTSNMPREQFEHMVERIVEYCHAGDTFQVVPSQRWSAELDLDPFSIYRGLRVVNPSPYMYFLDFGDFHVAGASPEPLLTVTGRHISTRPIAGTKPRGATPEEDEALAKEMLEDEKECAEHVMLVDLARNDLGRVAEYGSVQVDTFMSVEHYSHVMHIVSSVSAELREDVTAMDALRSVLPAGTLSGAPKVRAMQIIDELEPVKRGGYGGAIGYLSYTGDLDTCIHIRTVVVKDGVAHIQAGGGTVADAKPAYEFAESENKSRAVRRAIELALAQPDWP
ncbi:anthranilate synthase component I [Svornostia abyssi]|uniref:Anthranilate synthase component 1 n=1 Tax=Svornostia abyssi TaxID=2898438 RepID=A0ABY5PE31_9ACTN|nr:anthranilate synthase component I [Parviterribacteraceae bacterium J379]